MPEGLTYGYVVGRVFLAIGDTPEDPDRLPDLVPPTQATVSFTPHQPQKRTQGDGADITSLILKQRIACRVNTDGYIVDPANTPGVWLVTGTYEVHILTQQLGDPPRFYVEVTEEHTEATPLDLIQYVPNQARPTIPLMIEGPNGPEGPMGPQGPQGPECPQGKQGEQGLEGPQGEQGVKGDDGTGVTIIGTLNDPSELPPTGTAGDAYMIEGNLWVWAMAEWVDAGNIQGPEGPQGPKGDPGEPGTGAVVSVNGQTGEVNLSAEDVGALASDYVPPAPTYAEITGKPATFPPASHTHPISEVLDLQDHLSGTIKRVILPNYSGYVSYYEGSVSQGAEIVGGRVSSQTIVEDDIIRVEQDTGVHEWWVEPGFRPGVLMIEDTSTFEYVTVSGAVEIMVDEVSPGSPLTAYFWTPVTEIGIGSPANSCTIFF